MIVERFVLQQKPERPGIESERLEPDRVVAFFAGRIVDDLQRVDPQRGGRPFLVLAAELGQNDVEFRDLRVVQADLDRFALAGSLGIAAIVEIAPPTCWAYCTEPFRSDESSNAENSTR